MIHYNWVRFIKYRLFGGLKSGKSFTFEQMLAFLVPMRIAYYRNQKLNKRKLKRRK